MATDSQAHTTIVFVHGTGVRKFESSETFDFVRHATEAFPAVMTVACDWGTEHGARLHRQGASVPEYDTSRGVEQLVDDEVLLWGLLYEDPLYELRLLALTAETTTELPPGREAPGKELDASLADPATAELQAALVAAGIDGVFSDARDGVRRSQPYRDALRRMPRAAGPYRAAVARYGTDRDA